MKRVLLSRKYYGENIHDIVEDVYSNVIEAGLPEDEPGFLKGEFTVTVEWNDEDWENDFIRDNHAEFNQSVREK